MWSPKNIPEKHSSRTYPSDASTFEKIWNALFVCNLVFLTGESASFYKKKVLVGTCWIVLWKWPVLKKNQNYAMPYVISNFKNSTIKIQSSSVIIKDLTR